MLQLSKELKLQVFNLLKSQSGEGQLNGQLDILSFLERIWPLRTMTSDDSRFQTAYEDAQQHLLNNNDWDDDYTFLDRFRLLESDDSFNLFLQAIVSPEVRQNEDDIVRFILLIEPFIAREGYTFDLEETTDHGPVYKLAENPDGSPFSIGISQNTIPFYVEWGKTGNSNIASSHKRPPRVPSFVLVFNDGWNDYSIQSTFDLFYYETLELPHLIGEIKIISDSQHDNIQADLGQPFTQLDTHFCSLGQTATFYKKLKTAIGNKFESVLFALRDASLFTDNHDRFESNNKFINSLIRFDRAEQALRTGRYVAYDYDLLNLYTFSYLFKPVYSREPVKIDFEFSKQGLSGNRIYAIIGKNGTGKTQLITSMPIDISRKNETLFIPRTPFFSKVIAVSYSVFDQFEIPTKSSTFNYVYCGLRKKQEEQFTERGLTQRFYNSWRKIQTQGRLESWKKVLSSFVARESLERFIEPGNQEQGEQAFKINTTRFQETRKQLSSGQSIVFYIITEIVANIRYDSLLLYDEPEMHLHPNAITELIYIIYQLVEEFQSYCIIATHSPVIVRELFSRNVFVMEKEENVPSIRTISIESFGEDIGVLTDEVFGNKEVPKQYKKIIDNLAQAGNSFEQIVAHLEEAHGLPLSLNTTLYIRGAANTTNA